MAYQREHPEKYPRNKTKGPFYKDQECCEQYVKGFKNIEIGDPVMLKKRPCRVTEIQEVPNDSPGDGTPLVQVKGSDIFHQN